MSKMQRATVIGLVSGAVCFVILAGLLAITLLIIHSSNPATSQTSHSHLDMHLALVVALPVAVVTAVAGFIIAVVRFRTIDKHR